MLEYQRSRSSAEFGIQPTALENPDALSKDEVRRYIFIVAELFLIFEGQYKLYQKGYISADSWQSKTDMMLGFLRNSLVEQWWNKRMTPFSSEFIEYIDSLDRQKGEGWFPHIVANAAELNSKPPT